MTTMINVKLHAIENTDLLLMVPSVTSVTFYEGAAPVDWIRDKVNNVIAQNPWLEGRLLKTKDGLEIQYSTTPTCDSFTVIDDFSLNESNVLDQGNANLEKRIVLEGGACVNKNIPLFLVTVFRVSARKFAVVVSMSHVIGDGHTFYEVYGMISESSELKELIFDRVMEYPKLHGDALGGKDDSKDFILSAGVTISLLSTLFISPPAELTMRYVDKRWVDKEKEKFKISSVASEVPFVSTNDILTSWYFKTCKCDVGIMAMNMRSRLPAITQVHAGNYEALVCYERKDYESPHLIRQSIALLRRVFRTAFPGFFQAMTGRYCVLSSWVSFYREATLPDCVQVLHLPYVTNKNIMFRDIGILFRPTPDTIALLNLGRGGHEVNLSENPGLGGGEVNEHRTTENKMKSSNFNSLLTVVALTVVPVAAVTYYYLKVKV